MGGGGGGGKLRFRHGLDTQYPLYLVYILKNLKKVPDFIDPPPPPPLQLEFREYRYYVKVYFIYLTTVIKTFLLNLIFIYISVS